MEKVHVILLIPARRERSRFKSHGRSAADSQEEMESVAKENYHEY